MIKTVHMI